MAITKVRNPNGSIVKIEHPDDASQDSILGFAASQFNRGQGEEGIIGDALKALEVGGRSAELKGRAGIVETGVKLKDMASPTFYTPIPMMGMPTMSARQLEEEGIEAGKPIEEPERDLFKEDALQFAENLRIEANAMSNTVGLDKDFQQSFPGQVIQGVGQYGPMIMYSLVAGAPGAASQIAGMMDTEALEEAERTLGKKFSEMSDEEKQQTNFTRLGQQTIGTALNLFAFSKLIPTNLKGKVSQFLTNKGTLNRQEFTQVVNSLRKDIATSMAAEGITESAEAFSLDLLTKFSGLDSNREVFSVENIRENLYQGLVGSFSAGGTTTITGSIGKGLERVGKIKIPTPETQAVSSEEVSGKKKFRVKYTRTTKEIGQADVVSDTVREFDAKDEAEAKKIVEGSTSKLPGVDLESIIIEEVQPTETKVDPVVQEEVDTQPVTDPVDPQETGAEIPIGVFGDIDLDTVPGLTSQQKQKITELRQEANTEARKIFGALDDPTGELDAQAIEEGLEALRQLSEEGTVGATAQQKQFFDRIRDIERRQSEILGREYIPRTDASIVREVRDTIVRTPMERATPTFFVGATTADATTNRTDGRVVEPTGKVTKLVPDGEKLYEIKTTVKTSVRGSVVPEGRPSAEFQPVIRYVTAKSAQEAKQKYKDANDRAIQEQKRDSRANYPSTVQDEISQRASYKVREIKDYDNDDKTIIRNLFDASGFVFLKDTPFGIDPLIRGEAVGATDIVEQIDDDVDLEYGDVASETVDGESLGDAPVVGASVNLPNAPQISRKDFRGKKGFFYFSDRTKVGNYTGLFPGEGINIKLQGGPAYAFIQKNLDKLAGWAFTSENIFSKFLDKVKGTDGIGFITLYKKENLRANGTFLKAYVAEVKAAIKAKRITTKQFLEAANIAREQVVNLKSKNAKTGKITFTVPREGKGYELFSKPFKSVAAFEKAMDLVGFEPRGKMFAVQDKFTNRGGRRIKVPGELSGGRLAAIKNVSKGLPDVIKMIDLFSDPALEGRDRGDVIGAVQFDQEQTSSTTAQELGTEEHLSYPLVIKGKGIGAFSDPTNVLDVVQINKRRNEALRSAETSMPTGTVGATQQETQTDAERSVIGSAVSAAQKLAGKLGVKIEESTTINRPAQYNYETQTIQYNPQLLANRGKDFSNAAMREEIIHAAMHQVIMKRNPSLSAKAAFEKAMSSIGSDLTQEQKALMTEVYGDLDTDLNYGAEYTRFAVQHILDGKTTEGTLFEGKAMDKVKLLIRSVQSYVAKILGPELSDNRDAAFIIADTIRLLKAVDPNKKPAQQKFVAQAESILSGVEAVDAFADNPYATKEQKKKRKSETARRNRQSVVMIASSFFARIHPQIRNVVSNYFTKTERLQTQAFKQINNFQTRVRGIKNKKDKLRLKQLLYSTPDIKTEEGKRVVRQRDALLRKYNIYNDFKLLVQPLLDDLRTKAVTAEMPVGYLYEFFPRKVKDLEGLLNFYGKDIKDDFNSRMAKIDKAREDNGELKMNTDERAAEFRKYMLEEMYKQNVGERIPGFLKKRGKGMLSEEELQFYEDPEVALGGYVNTIIIETGKAELFGNGALRRNKIEMLDGRSTYKVNLTNQNGTLSRLVVELNNRGELSDRQLGDLFFGLDQMFGPADKNENQFAELGRTLSYGQLLVDPTTTLSQLYDLAFIALDNNLASIVKTIFTKKDFTLLDAGIDPKLMSAEFQSDNVGAKIDMGKIVKAGLGLSGFRAMDALMKETNLTVNYNRYKKLSKLSPNSSKFKKFRSEVEFMVGKEDADRTINDFKNGVYDSPYVRELVVRKLLETQPVNAFEMPMVIQKNPNMRMFYTMKSFILKQGNLINDRMISVIRSKTASGEEKRRAIAALIKLIFTFMMAGIPIDFIKDMIAGRDVYPEDYVDNALLRMFGLSKYNMYDIKKRNFLLALGSAYVAPVPVSQVIVMADSLQRNIGKAFEGEFTGQEAAKIARDFLPMDSLWYYRYGPGGVAAPGVESQRKKREREAKDSSSIIESLIQFPSGRQEGRRPMIQGNRPIGLDINELSDIIPFLRNM